MRSTATKSRSWGNPASASTLRLQFTHPRTGRPVLVYAPLPAYFQQVLEKLERDAMRCYFPMCFDVDFDRTLTAQNSTILSGNLEAIAYFMENGGAFTVNTGRSIPTFRQYLYTLPHSAPFLLYNWRGHLAGRKLDNIREIPVPLEQVVSEVSGKYRT